MCEGRNVKLKCSADGKPNPYVALVDSRGNVLKYSANSSSYTISSVKRDNEGFFNCSARNEAGEDNRTAGFLHLQCKCIE